MSIGPGVFLTMWPDEEKLWALFGRQNLNWLNSRVAVPCGTHVSQLNVDLFFPTPDTRGERKDSSNCHMAGPISDELNTESHGHNPKQNNNKFSYIPLHRARESGVGVRSYPLSSMTFCDDLIFNAQRRKTNKRQDKQRQPFIIFGQWLFTVRERAEAMVMLLGPVSHLTMFHHILEG